MIFQKEDFMENLTDLKNVLDALPQGTKIGYWVMCGPKHSGHEYEYNIIRSNSDFVISIYVSDVLSTFKSMVDTWTDFPKEDLALHFVNAPMREMHFPEDSATIDWVSSITDATLIGGLSNSNPSILKDQVDLISATFPATPAGMRPIDGAILRCNQTMNALLATYTKFDVCLRTHLAGWWVFAFEKWVKEVRNKECIIIPPYREDGVALSPIFCRDVSATTMQTLKGLLNGQPLITGKNVTKASIEAKLAPLDGQVLILNKYTGNYLDYHTAEGDTYINIRVKLKQTDQAPQYMVYMDSIIL